MVVLKVGVPENCPGPEPRGWLDGLKRRKWYEKAQAPEIRRVFKHIFESGQLENQGSRRPSRLTIDIILKILKRPVHPASYFKKGDQLHQDKTFGVFYHPKYYGKTKEEKMGEIQVKLELLIGQ